MEDSVASVGHIAAAVEVQPCLRHGKFVAGGGSDLARRAGLLLTCEAAPVAFRFEQGVYPGCPVIDGKNDGSQLKSRVNSPLPQSG